MTDRVREHACMRTNGTRVESVCVGVCVYIVCVRCVRACCVFGCYLCSLCVWDDSLSSWACLCVYKWQSNREHICRRACVRSMCVCFCVYVVCVCCVCEFVACVFRACTLCVNVTRVFCACMHVVCVYDDSLSSWDDSLSLWACL